jgi:DNA-binding protein HU-beta
VTGSVEAVTAVIARVDGALRAGRSQQGAATDATDATDQTRTRGESVNKSELIDHIAGQADISKAAAGRALEAVIGAVKTTLKKGGTVSIVGFGTFSVTKRQARTGRNPRTGAAIKIKASKLPKFRPGKGLKDAL